MSDYLDGKAFRKLHEGITVTRAAATHIAATTPYFTVTGIVKVTGIYSLVTVASGANACSWSVNPTAGTTVSISGNLDIDPALVGDLISWTGVLATALTYGGAVVGMSQPLIVTAGTIDFIAAAADGATSVILTYIPLTDGAKVVSA